MKTFDHTSRDPRTTPGTGDIVLRAGRKKPHVPIWSGSYSAVFGRGGQSISHVLVNPDCTTGEEAERRILARKGLSIRFDELASWQRMMQGAEVIYTNQEPAYVWDDEGVHCLIPEDVLNAP